MLYDMNIRTSCTMLGKCYRFVKLAALARCDTHAVFVQVWASSFLPNEPMLAERCQREYKQKHGEPMLLQYARMEAQAQVTEWWTSKNLYSNLIRRLNHSILDDSQRDMMRM